MTRSEVKSLYADMLMGRKLTDAEVESLLDALFKAHDEVDALERKLVAAWDAGEAVH